MDELLFFELYHLAVSVLLALTLAVTIYLIYRLPYNRKRKFQGLRCKPGKPRASLITHACPEMPQYSIGMDKARVWQKSQHSVVSICHFLSIVQ